MEGLPLEGDVYMYTYLEGDVYFEDETRRGSQLAPTHWYWYLVLVFSRYVARAWAGLEPSASRKVRRLRGTLFLRLGRFR